MMTPSIIGKRFGKIPKSCKLKLQNFSGKSGIFRENFLFEGESALSQERKGHSVYNAMSSTYTYTHLFLEFLVKGRFITKQQYEYAFIKSTCMPILLISFVNLNIFQFQKEIYHRSYRYVQDNSIFIVPGRGKKSTITYRVA